MEEMESQIREEIRKGALTQEPTHAHTNTHSNIVQAALSGLFRPQMMFCVDWREKKSYGQTEILTTYICLFVHDRVCVCRQNVCLFEISFLAEVGGRYNSWQICAE